MASYTTGCMYCTAHTSESAAVVDGVPADKVAAVCLFGWLNRFNDTMATPLEEGPLAFGAKHMAASGWRPGKHVSG